MGRVKFRENRSEKIIGTLDFETDPFKSGRTPQPFAAGYYETGMAEPRIWWGNNCADLIGQFLADKKEKTIVYAHNGGKFDFYFLWQFFGRYEKGKWRNDVDSIQPLIINGRIVEVTIGNCTLRDSLAIIPCALSSFGDKLKIDIEKLERECREENKEEICEYLKMDCLSLHKVVVEFREMFGDKLTVGSAALTQLTERHPWESIGERQDAEIRQFYFGGRVQTFERGLIKGRFSTHDINSQYPYSMANFLHPTGKAVIVGNSIDSETDFVEVDATTKFSCLPLKTEKGRLEFPIGRAVFKVTGHELRTAIELKLVDVNSIIKSYSFVKKITFDKFVEEFYEKRKLAKIRKDTMHSLFFKFVLNSSYGKFGQNPREWKETYICFDGDKFPEPNNITTPERWDETEWYLSEYSLNEHSVAYFLFERPARRLNYNHVGTAASITGAARSLLMRGLTACDRPLYCDTDSIISQKFYGDVDNNKLGAWKDEGAMDFIAIHSPKLYAGFYEGRCVKTASKGTTLTPKQILDLCRGVDATSRKAAPCYSLKRDVTFITRTVRAISGDFGDLAAEIAQIENAA